MAQGTTLENAKPVHLVSRTTSQAEKNYPQIDIEAVALDFALRRFRKYIIGAPQNITVVTDHLPLISMFNGKRLDSFRTNRIKMRHQDVMYNVI